MPRPCDPCRSTKSSFFPTLSFVPSQWRRLRCSRLRCSPCRSSRLRSRRRLRCPERATPPVTTQATICATTAGSAPTLTSASGAPTVPTAACATGRRPHHHRRHRHRRRRHRFRRRRPRRPRYRRRRPHGGRAHGAPTAPPSSAPTERSRRPPAACHARPAPSALPPTYSRHSGRRRAFRAARGSSTGGGGRPHASRAPRRASIVPTRPPSPSGPASTAPPSMMTWPRTRARWGRTPAAEARWRASGAVPTATRGRCAVCARAPMARPPTTRPPAPLHLGRNSPPPAAAVVVAAVLVTSGRGRSASSARSRPAPSSMQ